MGWLSAVIGGASSILGGAVDNIFAKKAAKKQYKYDKLAMQEQFELNKQTELERWSWLVEGAQNAGFNPLTVLGASGGAMGNAPTAPRKIAPLSNIGNAIAQAGSEFARYMPNPIDTQTQKLENELLRKQITQIDNENLRFGVNPVKVYKGPVKTNRADDAEWFRQKPLSERMKLEGGLEQDVLVGPDASEVFMGWAIDTYARAKHKNQFKRGASAYERNRVNQHLQRAGEVQRKRLEQNKGPERF